MHDEEMYDGPTTAEQKRNAAIEKHKKMQLSEVAYSLMLPVRANLYAILKSFSYEAKRTGATSHYINTLRSMLLWAEANAGKTDDQILDAIEDELDRVRAKQSEYAKNGPVRSNDQ
jgi:hypothetical protein